MPTKFAMTIFVFIVLVSVLTGIYVYPQLPDRIVSHWNAQGVADGTMPKFWGVFLLPIVLVAMFFVYFIVPKIDPLKNNIEQFRRPYNDFWVAISLFMCYIYAMSIAWNLGYYFNFVMVLTPALAVLWWMIGRMMFETKRNWFIGIRTPWTLSDDVVWDKTHRLGGRLFQVTAVATLVGMLTPSFLIYIVLISAIGSALVSIIYSYIVYRQIHSKPHL